MSESITLRNQTPRAYVLPTRKRNGETFGGGAVLPANGTLDVPRWYAEDIIEGEPAWRRRIERGDVTDGHARPTSPDPIDEARREAASAAEGRQRAEARVRELEAELDGVRATTRKQVAELEAQLEAARKPAPKSDDKPKADKPKRDEKPEG